MRRCSRQHERTRPSTDTASDHLAEGRDRRSRRGILAAAAGAFGVIVVQGVPQATPAQADNGDPVLQGVTNGSPTTATVLQASGGNASVRLADPSAGIGVTGLGSAAGVKGQATTGSNADGVQGFGVGGGSGVKGTSTDARRDRHRRRQQHQRQRRWRDRHRRCS